MPLSKEMASSEDSLVSTATEAAESLIDESSNPASNIQKRQRMSDDSKDFDVFENVPPKVKRSTSQIQFRDDDSFVSPKKGPCYGLPFSRNGRSSRRPLLRSFSMDELSTLSSSRKSLDFSDERSCETFGDRSLNASALSMLSTSTSSESESRHIEKHSLQKWNDATKLKRRRASASLDEGIASAESPIPSFDLNAFTRNSASTGFNSSFGTMPTSDECDVLNKMSNLDVSHVSSQIMAPPPTNLFARPFCGVHKLGVFETPTREQAIRMQCEFIEVDAIVAACKKCVKIAIFDLDETLLDIHTDSKWQLSGRELGDSHIRPVFKKLLEMLLKAGIPIAVATFSSQETIVAEMLEHLFGEDVILNKNVFVRGHRENDSQMGSQDDEHEDSVGDSMCRNKRKHIEDILTCLYSLPGQSIIASDEVLFIDDSKENAIAALSDGHRVVHYRESLTQDDLLKECLAALQPRSDATQY